MIILTTYDGAILGPIAKLLGWIMNAIYVATYRLFGIENVGLSILLLTILIYSLLLPLTYRQQKFSKMNNIMQPELNAIREKYKNRKDQDSMMAMNEENKMVYEKYGVSQSGSCVSLLIQMPILFALYRVFYNVPAYVTEVKDQFTTLVEGIVSTEGYADTMASLVSDYSVTTSSSPDWTTTGDTLKNFVVDVLYKLPANAWENLSSYFPTLTDSINDTFSHVQRFNYVFNVGGFEGLNISESPLTIVQKYFPTGQYLFVILALAIPICSYISQMVSIRMMPQQPSSGDAQADQMANQMKTMNTIMPIFSLVICFTVPVGLGIYWVFSAVYRCVQQFLMNMYFEKKGMEAIVEKQKEKAQKKIEKKREKQGVSEDKIRQAAQLRTRNIESRANMVASSTDKSAKEEQLAQANEKKANAKPGSMAAKANMVRDYNERNSRK